MLDYLHVKLILWCISLNLKLRIIAVFPSADLACTVLCMYVRNRLSRLAWPLAWKG